MKRLSKFNAISSPKEWTLLVAVELKEDCGIMSRMSLVCSVSEFIFVEEVADRLLPRIVLRTSTSKYSWDQAEHAVGCLGIV